jgi:hypothetical protein
MDDLIDKYLGEGKLSWKDVNTVSKRVGGNLSPSNERGKMWTVWTFKNIESYREFADEMQSKHMTIKGDPKKLEMKVWF